MLHILVVDDSPADRAIIRGLLGGCPQPLHIDEAATGAQALRACRNDPRGPPDCVLLDYFLPDYEAPEWLAALCCADLPCCPVVVLTGHPGLIDHRAMLRQGAQDVIAKDSLDAQGLTRCLENAMERFGMMRELRLRENRLNLALAAANLGTWDFDLVTGAIACDRRCKELFGLPPAAAAVDYHRILAAMHPDDHAHARQALQRAMAGPLERFTDEYRIIDPRDGGVRHWVQMVGQVLCNTRGRAIRCIGTLQDITENKRMEQALRQSEERARRHAEELAGLMDAAPIAILVAHDPECRVVTGNRMVAQLYERPLDQNLCIVPSGGESGRDLRFFRGGHELGAAQLPMQMAASQGVDVWNYEVEVHLPSGGVRWGLSNVRPLFDQANRVRGCIAAVLDITEQKQSEWRWRQLAEAMPHQVWTCTPDGACDYLSPQRFTYTGIPLDEQLGFGWLQCVHPDDYEDLLAAWQRATATGTIFEDECRLRRSDGAWRWFQARAVPIRDAGGRVVKWYGYNSDIDDLKATAAALRESEARLHALFESSDDALALLDEQGFIDCNEAQLRLIGATSKAQVLGRRPEDFSSPTQPGGGSLPALIKANIDTAFRDGNYRLEWLARRLDGTEVPLEILLTSVVFQGKPVLQVNARDISERRRMMAAMAEAKEAAEQANRAKSSFLANMSHEIRTPMTAIMGLTELCLSADPSPRQRSYLSKVQGAAQALLHIIDDILDFSKIEAGKLDLAQEPFAPTQVLEGVVALLTQTARDKGLGLTVALAPELAGQPFLGDPHRLGQVLINLVGNAIKFSHQGQVLVSLTQESLADGVATLCFAVRDEGIGIAADDQARLFQPFNQADASTTRGYGGTGLGLAISRRLAQLMGGRIWVQSVPGQGSTFSFTVRLPLSTQAPTPPASDHCQPDPLDLARLRGAEVLLVDDAPLNQEVIRELLEQAGLRVRLAANGEEALRAVADTIPDCVLMDCQMPVLDGLEAARRLRADARYRDLPIIALTANTMLGDQERCLAAGMDGFLPKPVDCRALYGVLAHWVRPRGGALAPAGPAQVPAPDAPFPALPGLDTLAGLAQTGGKPAFFTHLLTQFRDRRADDFHEQFQHTQAAADWPAATRLAHNLKGVARSLGAAALGDLADALEAATRQGRPELIAGRLAPLEGELGRVLAGLAGLDDPAAHPAPGALGPAHDAATTHACAGDLVIQAQDGNLGTQMDLPTPRDDRTDEQGRDALIRDLDQLLQDHDTAAVERVAALERALASSAHAALAAAIGRAIAGYDFTQARAGLGRLARSIAQPGDGHDQE